MSRLRLVLGLAASGWLLAVTAAVVAAAGMPALAAQRGELPEGDGHETVVAICGECHGAELIASQRRSRIEWEALIEDMSGRNAVATDEDKQAILGYALQHFGRVNINTAIAADLVEIVQLPAAEAAAIVDYRKQAGEFKTLEDLRKVPGIDFARIQERKDRIGFTGP